MLKVLVVEDDNLDFERLKGFLDTYSKENNIEFSLERFSSGKDFLNNLSRGYDIAFLDIDLKDSNGIHLAKALRKIDQNVGIIFVTNLAQFAINGYEVDALDFVVKPISYFDFSFKIKKAVDNALKQSKKTFISFLSEGKIIKLNASDIKYVEVMHHNLVFHTNNGDYSSYGSLKDLEEKLPMYFKRCNNCFLVNLEHVTAIQGYSVFLGDIELQISHPKKKEFLKYVNDFFNGNF